uniref:Uncharacterized protein n=1 Tax=Trichogramma kaykai TaxID=54128 RepID=A0ABD2WSC6_9HYME
MMCIIIATRWLYEALPPPHDECVDSNWVVYAKNKGGRKGNTRRAFQVRVMDLLQNFFAVSWYPILKLPVLSLIQWALGPIL